MLNPRLGTQPAYPYINPASLQYKKPENIVSAFSFGQHKRQKFTNKLTNHPIK